MVTQYYIFEVTRNQAGELAHDVSWAWDENPDTARLKGESAYYTKLAAAAVDNKLSHAVTLLSQEGVCVMTKCYYHDAAPEPAPEPEPEPENNGEE